MQETFKFWDLVRLILEVLQYFYISKTSAWQGLIPISFFHFSRSKQTCATQSRSMYEEDGIPGCHCGVIPDGTVAQRSAGTLSDGTSFVCWQVYSGKGGGGFYTPVFRRDVLWYGAVRPSVRPSVRSSVRPTVSTKKHRCKWRIFFKFCTLVCLGVPSINLLFVLSYLIKYAHNSIISDFSIFGFHRVIF